MLFVPLLIAGGALYAGTRLLEAYLEPREETSDSLALQAEAALTISTPLESEEAESESEVDLYLGVSLSGLTLAIGGAFFYGPLSVVSGVVSLGATIPIHRQAFKAIVKERRLRAAIVDSLAVFGILLSGFYISAALANSFYFVGRKLLIKTKDRSRQNLAHVFGEQQKSVWLLKDGIEFETPIEEVHQGDVVVVTAGQIVPVDGRISVGAAVIDQHKLTGEAQAAEKSVGDRVLASTLVLAGRICVEVESAGSSTVFAQLGDILNQTVDYRTLVESRAEHLADQGVLPLLGLAGGALFLSGVQSSITILFSNPSESMRITMPLSLLNYLSRAARNGILIKDGRALELLSGVDTVVFDKTGTLTLDRPSVGEIHVCGDLDADRLLRYAAAAEARQSHPLARAIVEKAAERRLRIPALHHARYQAGYGIEAHVEGHALLIGSARFLELSGVTNLETFSSQRAAADDSGFSLIYVALDGKLAGALELRPVVRPELRQVLSALCARGLSLCILSGDHETPTRRLALDLGIERYFAEVLPAAKADHIRSLQQAGRKVCFIGDGINDAIALKTADASISLCGAATAATDTAQIVLMDGTLRQLPRLFAMAEEFDQNARTTMIVATAPSLICIGGALFFHLGITTAVAAYMLSLAGGFTSAMLPTLRSDSAAANMK